MRDSPSVAIIPNLVDKGASIRAHDPQGADEARALLPAQVVYFDDVYETVTGADAIVLMTEWNEYRGLDLNRLGGLMREKVFIDLRNVYERQHMLNSQFSYTCIGR